MFDVGHETVVNEGDEVDVDDSGGVGQKVEVEGLCRRPDGEVHHPDVPHLGTVLMETGGQGLALVETGH